MVDVLVFGPHPDDIEICTGGLVLSLIAQGYTVGGVDLTAGEAGSRGDKQKRDVEAQRGAELLGLAFRECLGLPDGHIKNDEPSRDMVIDVIRRHRPRLVVAPATIDHHPDHSRTGELVKEARFLAGCARIGPEGEPWRPGRVLFYPSREALPPSLVVDVTPWFEQKMTAIAAHVSQLHNPDDNSGAVTTIASPEFLEVIEAQSRHYGSLIGVRHGEAYCVDGPLAVADPVPAVQDKGQSVFL
jgi:bacillithiol biosynthesis deacetylase BshB1